MLSHYRVCGLVSFGQCVEGALCRVGGGESGGRQDHIHNLQYLCYINLILRIENMFLFSVRQ